MRLVCYIIITTILGMCGCMVNPRFSKLPLAEQKALTPLTLPAEQLVASANTTSANEPTPSSVKDISIYKIDSQLLKEYLGRSKREYAYLYVYGTFCKPCVAEMPDILQIQKANKKIDFLMVSPESFGELDRLKEFLYKNKVFFPTYIMDLDRYGDEFNGVARYRKFVEEIYPGHPEILGFPTHIVMNKQHKVLFAASGARKFNAAVLDSVLRANH